MNNRMAVILDLGQRNRSLDASKSQPKSLNKIKDNTVLDWSLYALKKHEIQNIIYFGSYHIEKVLVRYPSLTFRYIAEYERQGELMALSQYITEVPDELIILRGETIVLPEAFEILNQKQNVYVSISGANALEFSGLIKLKKPFIDVFIKKAKEISNLDVNANCEDILFSLSESEKIFENHILDGFVAPVHNQFAVAKTIFKGKGRTLEHLSPLIRNATVLEQLRYKIKDWIHSKKNIQQEIFERFPHKTVVVRSSASSEDTLTYSGAGQYVSILNVDASCLESVSDAINEVIKSYTKNNRNLCENDEFLIQPQIKDIEASGVLLTRDPHNNAPYFILSLDKNSGRSDSVTSGDGNTIENYFISWSADYDNIEDPYISRVIRLGNEIIELSHLDALDIEFGISKTGIMYLFQVRPLVTKNEKYNYSDEDVFDVLENAKNFVNQRMIAVNHIEGDTTIFGVMPDWNPAEMIGKNPRPLALSLYQKLIGNNNWAEARRLMGYKDLTSNSLILSIAGTPYVDVRNSLNSFLPKGSTSNFSQKWVNSCIKYIKRNPHLHDKIEFEVAATCLTSDWDKHQERLLSDDFSLDEINIYKDQLRSLTEHILNQPNFLFDESFKKIRMLEEYRTKIRINSRHGLYDTCKNIATHLDMVGKFGIIPFAILARSAFISMAFLRGLSSQGILKQELVDEFMLAIPTVASQFARDQILFSKDEVTLDEMIEKYGHLRPNSYDICSSNYSDNPLKYFGSSVHTLKEKQSDMQDAVDILLPYQNEILQAFKKIDIKVNVIDFIHFMVRSISGREFAKFEFMKSINDILESIRSMSQFICVSPDELSYISIDELLPLAFNSSSAAEIKRLRRLISFNKKKWQITSTLHLPDLICQASEVLYYRSEDWKANFVTRKKVTAAPIWLDEIQPPYNLNDKIVITRAADPGYDWIFSHKIAGLITEYGGVASHMAIRASEFGLPAAIGAGSKNIGKLKSSKIIELDCENEVLKVIC